MIVQEILQLKLNEEAISVFEREERDVANSIKNKVNQLPAFPGVQMKDEIEKLIKSSAKLLKDFAEKALTYASERGYRTQVFKDVLQNPEKAAKNLIKKYTSSYSDNAVKFKISDMLDGINLDISK
jgi:hypothetical protein